MICTCGLVAKKDYLTKSCVDFLALSVITTPRSYKACPLKDLEVSFDGENESRKPQGMS